MARVCHCVSRVNAHNRSTDCTHIALGKCPVQWRNACIGKEGYLVFFCFSYFHFHHVQVSDGFLQHDMRPY
jgi:hypothetical protein